LKPYRVEEMDYKIRMGPKSELVSFQKSIGESEKWRYNVMRALKSMVQRAWQNDENVVHSIYGNPMSLYNAFKSRHQTNRRAYAKT